MSENDSSDGRAKRLQQVGDLIKAVATHHFHVEVDETTHQRMRHIMGLMREVNTSHDSKRRSPDSLIRQLSDGKSELFERYPALSPDEMESESFHALIRRTRTIFNLSNIVMTTRDLSLFLPARKWEGQHTANLLHDCATPFVRQQPAFTNKFMPQARNYAIGANYVDSYLDARDDYEQGKLKVLPDATFYKHVGSLAIKHIRPHLRSLLHLPVMREFGIMAINRAIIKTTYDSKGNLRPLFDSRK